jgi:integrase
MARKTQGRIISAPPKEKEYLKHYGDGLFLRVRPSGAQSWMFSYTLPGSNKKFRMTLSGKSLTAKEARSMLPELHTLVAQGIDPRNARAAKIAENAQAITMQKLFDAWIDFLKASNAVTPNWVKAHEGRWNLHLKSCLGDIFAKDITRAHLASALEAMTRKGIKEETRKALTTLNLMLDYGLTHYFFEQNPARVLKPKDFAASANRPRKRFLTLLELRRLWACLDDSVKKQEGKASSMSPHTAIAIKLLILTGARRGEVAEMRWDEIDLEAGTWIIPAEKTKNRQEHTIFLSALAIQLIKDLKQDANTSLFVFNTGLNSRGYIHTDALTRAIRRLMVKDQAITNPEKENSKKQKKIVEPPLKDMKPFTIHDLRRSAATAWGMHLKVLPHVIELMLNHKPLDKLAETYQRAPYSDEQKEAWIRWGELAEHQIAIEPTNVIPINKLVIAR